MLKLWDKTVVLDLVREKLGDTVFVVVSNRQPYLHIYKKGKILCRRGPGGVITALDPVMRQIKGLWVSASSGDADQSAAIDSKVTVPPENPCYTLKYVWLSKEENSGYYLGYANQALWPLMHQVFVRPLISDEHWQVYKRVNRKFAEEIYKEIRDSRALVFFQDYHLAMAAKFLKELKPDVKAILFWHIPWPTYDLFRILPQKQELLRGMLSYDLIGFHVRYFCHNFLDAVNNEMESRISRENSSVQFSGHNTLVRSYPISVDFAGINESMAGPDVRGAAESLEEEFLLNKYKVIAGLDRIDYTKGIPERIKSIDSLLEEHPELRGKIIFIQMGEISRIHIDKYKQLNDQINSMVNEINYKYGQGGWKPVLFLRRHLSFSELLAFYRLADVCLVTSLHDGMNLVAKEFISTRKDNRGVLVLSRFTGASRELKDSLLINPFSVKEVKNAVYRALIMDEKEMTERMKKLRGVVRRNNIWRWIGRIIADSASL